MCGICGKINFDASVPADGELIKAMARIIAHRGPDDEGFYTSGQVGLGHRRLSIIDVACGHQPMFNEDNTMAIVFNGEIYNHNELRETLEGRGHSYRTHSDTETILHAYEEWGTACAEKLRGMFAFAIWDERDRSLFLARDHFGIKPLYYALTTHGVSFASEMKAVLLDPEVHATQDEVALYDFFTFKFIPGAQTPFKEVRRLLPAHWMLVKDGNVRIERFWRPSPVALPATNEAMLDELEVLLESAVREELMSEVPLGVFLSGGVDSSLLTILNTRVRQEPVKTFSIAFEGERGYDESQYAQQVAQQFGTQHQVFNCGPDSLDLLPEILWHLEEPLADAALLPLYILCREARKSVTVVQCGDGADEAFGGYSRFYWDQYASTFAKLPQFARNEILPLLFRLLQQFPGSARELGRRAEKFSRHAGLPEAARYMNWFTLMPDAVKHDLLAPDFLHAVHEHRSQQVFEALFDDAHTQGFHGLAAKQYCEVHSFVPDDLMLKVDKIAMASALEGRFPFLDYRLAQFGMSLPDSAKIQGTELKVLLKRLLRKYMPADFVSRRKQGFEVPVGKWLRGPLRVQLEDTLLSESVGREGIFTPGALRNLTARLDGGDPAAERLIFNVYMFQQWRNTFLPAIRS